MKTGQAYSETGAKKVKTWGGEETRLLLAMRREGLQRKQIARVLLRSPKAIKTRLENLA
jgi:DNA-binding NarL/FixJ family response regulator